MGVPKFYRWLSERYPKINQVVTDSALLPEFDHLYLDMNGIIHGCTHPNHMDVSDVLSERDMMLGIMNYLDRIITQIVKPKVSVYMAIDGVAPRAKLNQQRSRRFRSAKDLAEATENMQKQQQQQQQAQSHGNNNNNKKDSSRDNNHNDGSRNSAGVFDSNCITPGTEFMAKVSDTIKYFIRKKIKEDPLWRNLNVIFSGHEVPGEGEHKIMQHIRDMRHQPGYQPNTRHCMYGQDADLIMLGLVSHEPHFTLLREIINFGFDNNNYNNKNVLKAVMKFTKQSDFQLLHLSVLREYLQMEFCYESPDDYNLERVIDDFVFMTFLVGNDFLPHMPTLDIGDGAFDLLFGLYKEQRSKWGPGNYLTQSGEISNASRLEAFFAAIGAVETDVLEQKEKDEAAYTKKRRKWDRRDGNAEGPSDAALAAAEAEKQTDYLGMIEALLAKHRNLNINNKGDENPNSSFVDGWTPVKPGEKDYKGRYYFEKLHMTPADMDKHWDLRKSYIEGLMWCLAYYYRGCISWGWYYPYHYGPMLSDLINLPKLFKEIVFELGEPLAPFEQLMGCLPPASAALVPRPYRSLMTSPESPIIQFYPQDFAVDMNGKRNSWEGVNILPFIDVNLLKATIATQCPPSVLNVDERRRNSIGNVLCYVFDLTCTDSIPSPNRQIGLTDITVCHSRVSEMDEPDRTGVSFKPELVPGTRIPYPGFPSLNVLPIASIELVKIGLNVFGMPSKYLTLMLTLHTMPDLPPISTLAAQVLGKSLFVNWPLMHEAKVVAISDETGEIRSDKQKIKEKKFTNAESERWLAESDGMAQQYFAGSGVPGSGGVRVGDIRVRLKLLPLQGMKTLSATGATKKWYGQEEADVPLQLALWQAPAPDPRFVERRPPTLKDRFPINSSVILTKGKHRGCKGLVVGVAADKKVGVKVEIIPPDLPFGLAIARTVHESYISSADAARILKLNPGVLGKIAGSLFFEPGRYDLGLNLKYGEGLCVVGYVRKKKEPEKDGKQGYKGRSAVEGKGKSKAWEAGDSLLVVGSIRGKESANGGEEEREEKIVWEYSPKAIRLVNAYRSKCPQLFTALLRQPNERKYDAKKVFGPNGEQWLPMIREWLNSVETAKLPRSPVSTESMPAEAVAAVERVSQARALAMKKQGRPSESLMKIPPNALYREGSTAATDVLLAADYNDNETPQLGDRVVNLCANGLPFGALGTIVGIHEAKTGCVEVVMDEEFIGGSSLQGVCSNFRGKLCVWAHLLKVSPADSQAAVDRLVPKISGPAALNKIIADIERHARPRQNSQVLDKGGQPVNEADDQSKSLPKAELAPSQIVSERVPEQQQSAKPIRQDSTGRSSQLGNVVKSTTPGRSSSRAGSAGRFRQGAWREAVGPDEKGTGFKGKRPGKSGFNSWKSIVSAKSAMSKTDAADTLIKNTAEAKAAELKALLGVSSEAAGATSTKNGDADAAAGLKALLGVRSAPQPQQPNTVIPEPPPPPYPIAFVNPIQTPDTPMDLIRSAAADRLLQMMANRQQHQQPEVPFQGFLPQPPPSHSSFNFTYVEEGKANPAPMPYPPPPAGIPVQWGIPYPVARMGMPPGPPPTMMMMPMPPPVPQFTSGFSPPPPSMGSSREGASS